MTLLSQVLSLLFACLFTSPQPFDEVQGLGHVKILDALPSGDQIHTVHGADFHVGVIDNAKDWKPIAAALSAEGSIDWNTQAVAYVILAEQTNALDFKGITVDDGGSAVFTFEWIGIEPFYHDRMPVIFKVVDTSDVSNITFQLARHEGFGGDTLGTLAIR